MSDPAPPQAVPLATAKESEDRKYLRKLLTRCRAAVGYIPSSADYDKESAALSSAVRETTRHLA